MDLAQFTQEMAARGCAADDKLFFGTYQGLPFSVVFIKGAPAGGTTRFSLRVQFSQVVSGKLIKAVAQQMKDAAKVVMMTEVNYGYVGGALAASAATVNANMLNLMVTVKKNAPVGAAFDRLIATVWSEGQAQGYAIPQACPVCNQPGCDAYAMHSGAFRPVHSGCIQHHAAQTMAKVQHNEATGSYALGTLGAVLGGLVGCLPVVLVTAIWGLIVWILGALVPLGAYYGYKLLRGKMTRALLAIVVVVSLLVIPVMTYLTLAFMWLVEDGFFLTPGDYLLVVGMRQNAGPVMASMMQNLLAVAVGFFCVFRILTRSNKQEWNEAAFAAATLRPMAGAAPAAPVGAPQPMPATQPAFTQPAASAPGQGMPPAGS